MNIGIIGSGSIGSLLARQWASLGHQVSIANSRGPGSLAAFAKETGVTPATVEQAIYNKDVVIIAIPQQSILNLSEALFKNLHQTTIIVDTGNYYPEVRDIPIPEIDGGMPESVWVSQRLGVPIIKAFNNMTIWSLSTKAASKNTPGRLCLSVAGDDSNHKQVILQLIDQIGFDGIDAGTLADSWRQQPGAPAYCMDLDKAALTAAWAKADHSRIADYRMSAVSAAKRAVEAAGSLAAATATAGKPGTENH